MTARIVFVLLLLCTVSVVHSVGAPPSTFEETENYIWFCPECCPKGEFKRGDQQKVGVYWYGKTAGAEILKHLREKHSKKKVAFYEGVLRSVPSDFTVKGESGRRKPAKSFLVGIFPYLDFNPDLVLREKDYTSKGMVRVPIEQFLIQSPSQPSKRPTDYEYKPHKRSKIQHEPQGSGHWFVTQPAADLAALQANNQVLPPSDDIDMEQYLAALAAAPDILGAQVKKSN